MALVERDPDGSTYLPDDAPEPPYAHEEGCFYEGPLPDEEDDVENLFAVRTVLP